MKKTMIFLTFLLFIAGMFGVEVIIGTGTTSNSYSSYPAVYGGWYMNAREQYIVNPAEFTANGGGAGNITSIAFNVSNVNGCGPLPNFTIRMGHTTQSAFTTTTFITGLTQVYNVVSYQPVAGWNTHTFDTAFNWDGTSNVVIEVTFDFQVSYSQNTSTYYTSTGPNYYKAMYYCSDNYAWNTVTTGTRSYNRPNMKFDMAAGAPMAPFPAILVSPANGASLLPITTTLNWASGGGNPTGYKLYFGTTSPPDYFNDLGNVTTYSPTLDYETTYFWKIVPYNSVGDAVDCPIWSFSTTAEGMIQIGTGTATQRQPFGTLWGYERSAALYTNAQIGSYGLLDKVAWNCAATTTTVVPYKIYAMQTNDTALTAISWDTFTANATLVDEGTHTFSTTGWHLFELDNPIPYVFGNLIVAVETNYGGYGGGSGHTFYYSTGATNSHQYWNQDSTPPTGTGTLNTNLPNIVLHLSELPTNPAISVTPTSWDFGQVQINTTKTKDFTISNIGGGTLNVSSIAVAGAYYTLLTNPAPVNLTAGQTAIFTVQYAPTAVGNHNGTVTITDNRGTTIVNLSAVCYDPTIYTFPWVENFGTTTNFPPLNWSRLTGLYPSETPTSTTFGWTYDDFANVVTTPQNMSARLNIWSTSTKYWLVTPPIAIPGTGYELKFDLALTTFSGIATPPTPGTQPDDRFIVLISDSPLMTNPTVLREWNNTGSAYVYDNISPSGENHIISLNTYSGTKYLAFYGESTVSGGDNNVYVDNVIVRLTPAGAPDHVTLVSPANEATYIDPENAEVNWTPAITGGNPAYYEVLVGENPFNPEEGYFGEYSFETVNTSLNLSEQDIVLPFSSTWYWAVLPYNADGLCPDPLAPEFMVWSFTIAPDPTITSLPYAEYFDGVTAPALPWGWSAFVNSTSTSAYVRTYSSTTYAQSPPNSVIFSNSSDTNADLRLISPPIDLSARSINRIKLKFYARSSSAGYPILIGTVSAKDSTGIFTQVTSINLTVTKTEYVISLADYVGTDQYICFKHGLGGTYRSLYVDDVKFIELQPADLAATSITGPTFIQAGNSYDYVISVFNEGTAEQSSYTVNLKTGTETLATLNVTTPLASSATAQHTLSWIPAVGGVYPLYGEVILAGDGNPANNNSNIISAYVVDPTMTIIPVGDDASTTTGNYLPLNMYFKNCVTEELYFTDEMHLQTGTITAIVYKNNFVETLIDKPVKIWMAHTDSTSLVNGWLPSTNYTLVFDGTVTFPTGINEVVIPLDTPFNFTGGVLATRVNRPMDTVYYSSSDKFYYTTTAEHTNRSRYLQSDSVVYDPLAPSAAGTVVGYVPNTYFVVQNAVMQQQAVLEGYVRDSITNLPIVGATVTLTERVSTTTNEDGFYHIGFWESLTVDATASMLAYYNLTFTDIALTLGTTVTQNFNLVPMPRVTVSGIVTSNDYPAGLVGATVSISGIENYDTITETGGAFSINNVLGSVDTLSYALTVEKEGYQSYISALNVVETNVNVGTINLVEYLWTPYNLVATHSGNDVSLVWEPAGEPNYYLYDFEVDNGGWVSSGYGDWEWGNTYNVANFVYTYTGSDVTPPPTAHSGTGMWGTKLLTNYNNSGAFSYLTQTIDLSGFTNPQLSFWSWENAFGNFDYCQVAVNGTVVWGPSWDYSSTQWRQRVINLSAYENQSVVIQFQFYATTTVNYAGWYIDDIYIGPASRNIATTQFASRSSQDRWFLNYSVHRFPIADEGTPANWTLIQTGVTDTTYLDTTFGTQPGGKYKWAVIANYSGSLQSEAIISNYLGNVATPQDVVANNVGATVQLSWTVDPGADYYVIYAADDPYGTFTVLGYSNTNSYTIATPPAKKFFKIASADGEMPVAKGIEPPAAKNKK